MTRQGRPAYDCIMIVQLGQYYSLSDKKLASSLKAQNRFYVLYRFTPICNLPDYEYSTINKYRNLLIEKKKLKKIFKSLFRSLILALAITMTLH